MSTCDVPGVVRAVMESKRRLGLALWSLEDLRGTPQCTLHRFHYRRLHNLPADPVWSSVALHGSEQPPGERHPRGTIRESLEPTWHQSSLGQTASNWFTSGKYFLSVAKKRKQNHLPWVTHCVVGRACVISLNLLNSSDCPPSPNSVPHLQESTCKLPSVVNIISLSSSNKQMSSCQFCWLSFKTLSSPKSDKSWSDRLRQCGDG